MSMRSCDKRAGIVAAACAEFPLHGYAGTTMSAIADRARCSKATLYGYFPSKDELFVHVVAQVIDRHMAPIFAALDAGGDLGTRLREFGVRMLTLRLSPEMLGTYRVVVGEAGRSEIGSLLYREGLIRWRKRLAEFLTGKLLQTDADVAASHLRALLEAELLEPLLLGARTDVPLSEIVDAVDRAVTAFLAAHPPIRL